MGKKKRIAFLVVAILTLMSSVSVFAAESHTWDFMGSSTQHMWAGDCDQKYLCYVDYYEKEEYYRCSTCGSEKTNYRSYGVHSSSH